MRRSCSRPPAILPTSSPEPSPQPEEAEGQARSIRPLDPVETRLKLLQRLMAAQLELVASVRRATEIADREAHEQAVAWEAAEDAAAAAAAGEQGGAAGGGVQDAGLVLGFE